MEPTLLAGQSVLVDLQAYQAGDPRPGELVLLHHPLDPNMHLIKRVRSIDAGRVFVVGDNGAGSTDSRDYGAVPLELILGRAVCALTGPN